MKNGSPNLIFADHRQGLFALLTSLRDVLECSFFTKSIQQK